MCTCSCHSATHTALRVLSLLLPPHLTLKGQNSSSRQMEFIHSCAPTSIILTNLTGRLTECWTLFMSPTFCRVSSRLCLWHAWRCARADMDFIIDHTSACFSDLLAGEEKKACAEIFLKSHHYLYSKQCCTLSDGAQKFLDADCGNRFYQTPYTQRRDWDREKERNRCQLSSSLYRDYLKFFAY